MMNFVRYSAVDGAVNMPQNRPKYANAALSLTQKRQIYFNGRTSNGLRSRSSNPSDGLRSRPCARPCAAVRPTRLDLGARIDGDPAALTRMPADIATLADGMWQRALKLAGEAATHDDNAARERLRQLQTENDIKQRSLELREREIDTQARERERALANTRDHLLSLSKALAREQATNQAQERRIADLEVQVAEYRQQIGALIAGAIAKTTPKRPRRTKKRAKSPNGTRSYARSKKPAPTKTAARHVIPFERAIR
jgi:hypothetical protein